MRETHWCCCFLRALRVPGYLPPPTPASPSEEYSMPNTTESSAGILAVVKKKVPDPATVPALKVLLKPPAGHEERRILSAYVVPTVLIGLLDCIADHEVDAAQHLDALDVRPVWRQVPANLDGAARLLVNRLRSASEPACLVLLFGPRRKQGGDAQAAPAAPPPVNLPAPTPAAPPQLGEAPAPVALQTTMQPSDDHPNSEKPGSDDAMEEERAPLAPSPPPPPQEGQSARQAMAGVAANEGTGPQRRRRARIASPAMATPPDGTRAGRAASQSTTSSRRLLGGVPPAEGFIPLSRPCVLAGPAGSSASLPASHRRPSAAAARGSSGGDGSGSGGGGSSGGGLVATAAEEEAALKLQNQWRAAMLAAAWRAADKANAIVCGGPSAPPLKSQHHLPTEGNWVRLAGGQQYAVRRAAETSRRLAVGGFQSFGNETRLSASRRWAHQTASGRCAAHMASTTAASSRHGGHHGARPGSFLPLKATGSVLHAPRSGRRPYTAPSA